MKGKMKQRIIALLCVVCMLCTGIYVNEPLKVQASGSTATTVDGLLAEGFVPWTLSDVGIEDQTVTDSLCWGDGSWQKNAAGTSLDKTIFGAKFNFAADSTSFGNIYIGGDIKDSSASAWRGFIFRGYDDDDPNLTFGFQGDDGIFYDKNGATNNQIAAFYKDDVGVELRGNDELEIAISVEYLDVVDELVTMQVGVFFNGQLFNGTYYTVKDVPEKYLTQSFRWYKPSGTNEIKSASLVDITLENAPERDFAEWTFSDLGIDESDATAKINWNSDTSLDYAAISTSLDKTIFNAKMGFDNATNGIGYFFIGTTSATKWSGFRVYASGTTDLTIDFQVNGTSTVHKLDTFNDTTAKTTLRGNSELQFSLSVEYVSVTDDNATMKVGVFFDGKLYDNTYYIVPDVPISCLNQGIRYHMGAANAGTKNAIASHKIEEDIMLENAPESAFEEWTLDDVGIADQPTLTSDLNWTYPATTAESLHKSIFSAKVYIPTGGWNDVGQFYIGGTPNTSNSKYSGFMIRGVNETTITFDFQDESGTVINIQNISSDKAGIALRGNKNLQISVSVEVLSVTDGLATVKIGLFFNGKLYNNEYITKSGLAEACLTRHVKWKSPAQNPAIASYTSKDITLQNAAEKDFTYWTLRDINCSDYTFTGSWNYATATNLDSLDKTIFNAKVLFSADSGSIGNFYIGGDASGVDTGRSRGFVFISDKQTDTLTFGFHGPEGYFYNANGKAGLGTSNALAVFDSDTAGTTLRGNRNLQVSLSVEILETKDVDGVTTGTVKVGVFFDGKLYDNTYYTVADVPVRYLTKNVRWSDGGTSVTNSLGSWVKASNVALASNGATVITSHSDGYSENTGYGVDVLIDGVAGQNDPYYLGATGTDLQNETTTIEIAFNDAKVVDTVRMYKKWSVDGFPVAFTIDAYTANGWENVATETDYCSIAGWNEITFTDIVCSAIRINVTENGKEKDAETYGLHITEIEVWGVPSNEDIPAPHTLTKDAVALSFATNDDAANDGVFKGNEGLRVVADTQTESTKLQLMFDYAVTATGVQFYSQEPGEFPSDFGIYAFTGSKWELIKSVTDYTSSTTKTLHEFTFDSAVTCSSIMLVVTNLYDIYAEGGAYGLQLQEMRVEGVANEDGCSLLGDGDANAYLTQTDDMKAFRETLVTVDEPTETFDINMDSEKDICDLVRMKRYFATEEAKERTYDITALSWNVLAFQRKPDYQDQDVRAPHIADYILENDTDLVGLQEAGAMSYDWATEYDKLLCENGPYASVKISDSEIYRTTNTYYMTSNPNRLDPQSGLIIYYKAERFTLLDSGAQQYSISVEGGQRWFQWVKLEDKRTGETVFMTNTHWSANLDAEGNESTASGIESHAAQAPELLNFWKETVGNNILIATGDYNAYQDADAIDKILTADIYKEANPLLGDFSSLKSHIDHVFVNPQKTTVENWYFTKDKFTLDGTEYDYSDHYPVFAELSYKN